MQKGVYSLAGIIAFAVAARAQTSRGAVSGTVMDASGALVPGAGVLVVGTETGARRSALTNEAGIYRLDAVDLGVYEIRITHPGFKAFVSTGLSVEANRTSVIDARLEVGSGETAVQVSAEAETAMLRDAPLRGGNFLPRQVSEMPLIGLNPISLARTLPGVVQTSGSALLAIGGGEAVQFSVNGQRTRGNNFLLDGTENNDIAFTGVAQPFNIADAVEEVSVQTGNYSVEFGRASGGIFNVVTKSGTNTVHGTLSWRYRSQRFESVSNVDKLNGTPKSVFSHNVAAITAGGPIRKDRTFFFAAFQQDTRRSTATFPLVVPTAATVDRLRSLFPSNPRLDLYLGALGDLRGSEAAIGLALGVDPRTGMDRGSVQFATASLGLPSTEEGPQWLARVDHYQSEAHRLSWRYLYDSRINSPVAVTFPGFIIDTGARNQNLLFADSYTFGASYTNEFRFSYGQLHADQSRISPQSVPLAKTLPVITFQQNGIASPGVNQSQLFRYADNLLFQETQTKLSGRHIFRYGVEWLRQLATQNANAYPRGEYRYQSAPGFSAFANFLDDFSGPSGSIRKTAGDAIFYPNQFHQSYFFQDTWKTTPSLTLTMGLRYENFGMVANAIRYPAFAGFDPARFFEPNKVNPDNLNFGPAFGLAWSPSFTSGWLGKLLGDHRTVWRGGYQVSYQALPTQVIALDLAASAPNAMFAEVNGAATGRGAPNWFAQLPSSAERPSLLNTQYGTLEKNFRNPYTERWSFGVQRQLPGQTLLDVSYVGSESHKLTTRVDVNPH